MKDIKAEILRSLLECDEYLEDLETSHFKSFETLHKDLSNKFCDCLPPELQTGFKALMAISYTLRCESLEIGKVIGIKMAYEVLDLLHSPKIPLEHLMQTYPTVKEMNAMDINTLYASIANYQNKEKESDT